MESILSEILRKECETYNLVDLGLVKSPEDMLEDVAYVVPERTPAELADMQTFLSWRTIVLKKFYWLIGFNRFMWEGRQGIQPKELLSPLKRKVLNRYRERYQGTTIDADLMVPPRTVAFMLSPQLEDDLHEEEVFIVNMMQTPSDIEKYYQQRCPIHFPLDLDAFLERLAKFDPDFWEVLYAFLHTIATRVTSYIPVSRQYKAEVLQDAWSETILFMRRKVCGKEMPRFESALHFRHYIERVSRNKAYEALRINQPPEVAGWGDEFWQNVRDTYAHEPSPVMEYMAIDPTNEDEVNRALAVILLDKEAPLYDRLTADIREKVELMVAYCDTRVSYDEMTGGKYSRMSPKEKTRYENNLRQKVSRTRHLIRKRFINLLTSEQNRHAL